MEQQTTDPTVASRVTWERLEACLRGRMRQWIQELLEAEVDELLGRRTSARRQAVDGAPGSRSGHGKPRRLTLCHGTVTVRRPRVRGLEPRVESRRRPRSGRCGPSGSSTGLPRGTLLSPCAACWGRTPPARRRPWVG